MYYHFIYLYLKKEKEEYLVVHKSNIQELLINDLNMIIYKEIYNLDNQDNINYFELFYIKKGLTIEDNIWNDIINLYINTLDIISLINNDYINSLYEQNILLFKLPNTELNKYICNYYNNINNNVN